MSATERLRAMLDERGVPWKDYGHENHTWWGEWHAENRASVNGLFLKVEGVVTPEQAIEATLGRGENEQLRKERDALDHLTDVLNATNDSLLAENVKLRELVRRMFYAVHPADREKFLTNVAELGVEV